MERRTYVYRLMDRNYGLVYIGISNTPEDRAIQHQNDGKIFHRVDVLRGPMSRENAEQLEHDLILKYQLEHGRPPRYNRNKTSTAYDLDDIIRDPQDRFYL
jgi:hypothetical protein